MAKIINTKKGKKVVLRNPSEKAKRYARQLKSGQVQETGAKLKPTDKAFRIGYLTARSDNAKAYKHTHKPKKKGRPVGSKDSYKRTRRKKS